MVDCVQRANRKQYTAMHGDTNLPVQISLIIRVKNIIGILNTEEFSFFNIQSFFYSSDQKQPLFLSV